ncbi:MAG: hypothetical protein LBK70_00650 [Clostridiales bacterium]|jgi:Mn2+/Fe2+ NRAMP family transporter|nr:hypothetical protein [Clostridiales bacterium]
MSNGDSKSTLSYIAVISIFILAVAIGIAAIMGLAKGSSNIANLIKQIATTISITVVLFLSFDRIKKFKSRGWLIAYIVACCAVVIFLVLEFVNIFQSL